jgi:mRNA-degrading endonuclease RelE of RelBE toxin-antitoxin system
MTPSFFAFIETSVFTEEIQQIADDETLFAIQNALLANPKLGDVIPGTNGARKGRISDPKRGKGKRGGFRFIYVFLERSETIYLLDIYSMGDQADLSPKQARLLGELVKSIKKGHGEK